MLYNSRTFRTVGTDVQIYYKKYCIRIYVYKIVFAYFVYLSVPTNFGGKMNKDKIKIALQLCSEKRCDECHYNRWVKEVCQSHLCKDALKALNESDKQKTVYVEQFTMNV